MNTRGNPLRTLAYFIVGIVVLIVFVQVFGVLLNLAARVVASLLEVVLLVALGYFVYLMLRAMARRQ